MKRVIYRIIEALSAHPWAAEVFVFIFAAAVAVPLQLGNVFADPDSFYHLKMAELTAAFGPVRHFTWLPFTTLAQNFADHHFLYHVALIPFVKILGPLAGMKASTVVFAAFAAAILVFFLRKLGVRYAWVWGMLFAVIDPLVFRLQLAKASSLALALLMLGLYFTIVKNRKALAAVAFIYVWTHAGWPALLAVAGIYLLIDAGADNRVKGWIENAKTFSTLAIGTAAGIVINPFFPQNLRFYWEQIVQIALVNYQDKIGVGGEWYPYGISNLLRDLPLHALLVVAAILCTLVIAAYHGYYRRVSGERATKLVAFWAIAILFFVFTLRSRRHVEYLVPAATIAVAFTFDTFTRVADETLQKIKATARAAMPALIMALLGAVVYLAVFTSSQLSRANSDLHNGYRFTLFQGAAEFLRTHAAKDEVVVHADWDDFPPLFWWDSDQHYIMGLDPTFMYRADPARYRRYVDFTLGTSEDPIGVMDELGARYVCMDHVHQALQRMLENTGRFVRVYGDSDSYIYRLSPEE